MSPRVFIGVVGVVILIATAWLWGGYQATVNVGSGAVTCGTFHDGSLTEEAHKADMKDIYRTGGEWRNSDACASAVANLAFPIYGGLAIGLLTIGGAVFVRPKRSTNTA